MAMDLSFDFVEKYFWTWVELFRLGPRRFSDRCIERPDSYMPPVQFFFGTLAIFGAIVLIGVDTLIQSKVETLARYKTFFGGDTKTYMGRHTLYLAILLAWGALANRAILWWPLKSPATIKNILIAKCYGTATLVPFAAFDAIAVCMIVLIGPHVSADALKWMWIAAVAAEFVFFGTLITIYDLWAVSAFCQLRIRRLLEGQALFCLTSAIVGGCLGMMIGGTVGGIRGGWNASSVHTLLSTTCIVLISVALSFSVAAVVLVPYIYLLRKRLVVLQRNVQTEYRNYRVIRPY